MSQSRHPENHNSPASDPAAGAPRILIIKRSSLGDIVHAMPVACALRRAYPGAYIAWVVERRFEQILHGHPAMDEIIPIRRHRLHRPFQVISDVLSIRRKLHSRNFDWAIDLQGLFKSAFVQLFSGAPRRIGLEGHQREMSNLVINEQVSSCGHNHAVEHYLEVARYLGADPEPLIYDLPVNPDALQWARKLFAEHGMFDGRSVVGINPTTSAADKNWDPGRFVDMANAVEGVNWVITGAPSDREVARTIADGIRAPALVTAGETDIARLVAVISLVDLLVTGDSGPLHIAVAQDVPTVALFGPTNPNRTGPPGDIHRVIWHGDSETTDKSGRDCGSMDDITSDEVAIAVRNSLNSHVSETPATP